ncbi:hypothetical protein CLAFUW4_00565 [Fulvia fulva]|uniref:Uncharacterized protein n=1 Tax=Passalora fulva TaxID=5499 RepID=A0A9Q8L7K3_PASFU|nr:uncharacterized protein CLAFUR5_00564 [Fulvia fulva]KAK4634030.1 hypothetical protein CLAFUR4_00566 [Fulvia fulva]KAK4637591.1 hypothetical protein CLAFUR0_00567 [Fulvia fulva]UJO12365.1 hypothetical protein CLAFUR5_00564 [Fulvia fulva]WPV08526.1 hypothetical protein CLAFUW4_00565 [Fulvia fulva]WPV23651.1 hypothetical protein CLAFUW7_00570 [Fulvia fulva]
MYHRHYSTIYQPITQTMGNCCGKGASDENFQGEGRTLGAQPTTATAPAKSASAAAPHKISSQGRTLGNSTSTPNGAEAPGAAAARAAEERVQASRGKGKLGKQLDAQRSQTQATTLAATARDNVAAREADALAQTRNYN